MYGVDAKLRPIYSELSLKDCLKASIVWRLINYSKSYSIQLAWGNKPLLIHVEGKPSSSGHVLAHSSGGWVFSNIPFFFFMWNFTRGSCCEWSGNLWSPWVWFTLTFFRGFHSTVCISYCVIVQRASTRTRKGTVDMWKRERQLNRGMLNTGNMRGNPDQIEAENTYLFHF